MLNSMNNCLNRQNIKPYMEEDTAIVSSTDTARRNKSDDCLRWNWKASQVYDQMHQQQHNQMRQQKDKQNAAAEANAIDKSDQNLNQYNQMRR